MSVDRKELEDNERRARSRVLLSFLCHEGLKTDTARDRDNKGRDNDALDIQGWPKTLASQDESLYNIYIYIYIYPVDPLLHSAGKSPAFDMCFHRLCRLPGVARHWRDITPEHTISTIIMQWPKAALTT